MHERSVRISSEEFAEDVVRYTEEAEGRPVIITREGREATVLLPVDEYVRLMRRAREVAAREVAYIDSVLASLAEDAPALETVPGARIVSYDADKKMAVVELQIGVDLLQESEALCVDVAAAAIAGIQAAVERARGGKRSA